MRANDRLLLIGFVLAGLLAAFWFAILSPKRDQAAELEAKIESLQGAIAEQEQLVAAAERAKRDYRGNYHQLVVLGKAVPAGDDTASLFVELQGIADRTGVELDTIELTAGGGSAAAAPATAAAQTQTDQAAEAEGQTGEAEGESAGSGSGSTEPAASSTPTAAPPTEAAAATLPLGATVGPAGLPVMPYELQLRGDFFQLADFMRRLDELVGIREGSPFVNGRLVTTDGFELGPDPERGFPKLAATLNLTTYVTPPDQGLTAGATPAAPPASSPAPTPVAETAATSP